MVGGGGEVGVVTGGVTVTGEADLVKRAVGPIAWLVLEHLVLTADAELESGATARSVAAVVSVSKDTAAAAIRRLEAAGLVERRRQGRRHGRFDGAGLRVSLPAGVSVTSLSSPTTEPPLRQRTPRQTTKPAPSRPVEQLSLIDETHRVNDTPTRVPIDDIGAAHTLPSPDRTARHEFASSDAGRAREREPELEGGSSC